MLLEHLSLLQFNLNWIRTMYFQCASLFHPGVLIIQKKVTARFGLTITVLHPTPGLFWWASSCTLHPLLQVFICFVLQWIFVFISPEVTWNDQSNPTKQGSVMLIINGYYVNATYYRYGSHAVDSELGDLPTLGTQHWQCLLSWCQLDFQRPRVSDFSSCRRVFDLLR